MATAELRPLERRVLALSSEGVDLDEIARRFKRSPEHMARVMELAQLERPPRPPDPNPLRPLERRVLKWRSQGAPYEEIGRRFRRGPDHMRRVEDWANYKLGQA